uniref:LicA homolog n=1 Tax=Metamycoplasma arthritidis TaxID=2111 RepID=Q9ZAQ5_METAT|nr:LicA homolog [Metamycoplasma arthritidis]
MITKLPNQGFTNITYFDNEKKLFIKHKNYDSFNHKIDYFVLNNLPFAPEIIGSTKDELVTSWIEGKLILATKITDKQLQEIAHDLITLHDSKLLFPKENQIARRFKVYRGKIKELNRKIPILDPHYKIINKFLAEIDNSAPVHNDLWLANMIQTKNKIYITDWEYASMGDVHFDLAYFIESSNLDQRQEQLFLEAYGDDFEPKYLLAHKVIVNALIALWINARPEKPFDDSLYLNRVNKYVKAYLEQYR